MANDSRVSGPRFRQNLCQQKLPGLVGRSRSRDLRGRHFLLFRCFASRSCLFAFVMTQLAKYTEEKTKQKRTETEALAQHVWMIKGGAACFLSSPFSLSASLFPRWCFFCFCFYSTFPKLKSSFCQGMGRGGWRGDPSRVGALGPKTKPALVVKGFLASSPLQVPNTGSPCDGGCYGANPLPPPPICHLKQLSQSASPTGRARLQGTNRRWPGCRSCIQALSPTITFSHSTDIWGY